MGKKGITLTSLVVTIILLGILATTTIYQGIVAIKSMKMKKLETDLKIVQVRCNELLKEGWSQQNFLEKGQSIQTITNNNTKSKIENAVKQATGENDTTDYIYYDKKGLESLGILKIDREIVINLSKKRIIDINGVKNNNDEMTYTIAWVGYSNALNVSNNTKLNFKDITTHGFSEVAIQENTENGIALTLKGQNNVYEKANILISNLEIGTTYRLYFSAYTNATLVTTYNYGCTISNEKTTQTTQKLSSLLWSTTKNGYGTNQTITFTADAETMYWTWDFSGFTDNVESNFKIYDVHITKI